MRRQRGFTYLGLLFAVALVGLLLASTGEVWQKSARREREEELLFIGEQFSAALASYRSATPGEVKHGPHELADLVEDKRWPVPRRHLRKIFFDPMTGQKEWGVLVVGGEIRGVYSQSQGKPIKAANFPPGMGSFGKADSYKEWLFTPADEPAGQLP